MPASHVALSLPKRTANLPPLHQWHSRQARCIVIHAALSISMDTGSRPPPWFARRKSVGFA
jgi:hypothetical protein